MFLVMKNVQECTSTSSEHFRPLAQLNHMQITTYLRITILFSVRNGVFYTRKDQTILSRVNLVGGGGRDILSTL